jgi:hypothetical protein
MRVGLTLLIASLTSFVGVHQAPAEDATYSLKVVRLPESDRQYARYGIEVNTVDGANPSHKCLWIVAEERNAPVIWPQGGGRVEGRLPFRHMIVVSNTTQFPILLYVVGGNLDFCAEIKGHLPPNRITPIVRDDQTTKFEDFQNAAVTRICEIRAFDDPNILTLATDRESCR